MKHVNAVIAELLDERREMVTKIAQIDEALLALQRISGRADGRGGRRNLTPEGRQRMSDMMRQRWDAAKAAGQSRLGADRATPQDELTAAS